jgi:AP-4 complex subunit mu-1
MDDAEFNISTAISQIFILSSRGDPIIFRDFRGDVTRETPEIFFRQIKQNKGTKPIFNVDGIHYCSVKQSGLYFVCTTKNNLSPFLALELLTRLGSLFKDYCGILSEEAIRKNFVLIYELLDEVLDFGYIQGTSTESLKAFVFNEPVLATHDNDSNIISSLVSGLTLNPVTQAPTATNKPIQMSMQYERSGANEIYVDLVERLTVLFNAKGEMLRGQIDGFLRMVSFLQGNPEIRLALNEELVVGKSTGYGILTLDDLTFHECVRLTDWERERTLTFRPPDGEFTVLNYRISSDDFKIPFRIYPLVEEVGPDRLDLLIKVRLEIPEEFTATGVVVRCPIPKSVASAKCELNVAGVEYQASKDAVEWTIATFTGGSELFLRSRITLTENSKSTIRKEFGPVSLNFELPMFNCSSIKIRYLRVFERDASYNPYRWVRNISVANSYICRI